MSITCETLKVKKTIKKYETKGELIITEPKEKVRKIPRRMYNSRRLWEKAIEKTRMDGKTTEQRLG